MMEHGISLRCLLLWTAWVLTFADGIAWAVFREPQVAQVGIVLLTLACTLNILADNARTRSLAWRAISPQEAERPVSRLR